MMFDDFCLKTAFVSFCRYMRFFFRWVMAKNVACNVEFNIFATNP